MTRRRTSRSLKRAPRPLKKETKIKQQKALNKNKFYLRIEILIAGLIILCSILYQDGKIDNPNIYIIQLQNYLTGKNTNIDEIRYSFNEFMKTSKIEYTRLFAGLLFILSMFYGKGGRLYITDKEHMFKILRNVVSLYVLLFFERYPHDVYNPRPDTVNASKHRRELITSTNKYLNIRQLGKVSTWR